ncbi:hypothetical protein GCM10025734_63730 [Kitasatospora paranensis]
MAVHGPNPVSAQAVAGKLKEKASTPAAANAVPPTATGVVRIALSCAVMHERSSGADLAAILRKEVERYPVGTRLPSSRALMERHQVSPVTVSRAIALLAADGLVVSRPGAGVFRAAPPRTAPPAGDTSWQEVALSAEAGIPPARSTDASGVFGALALPPAEVIDLNGGYLHASLQPERALAAALARAGRRPGAWGRPRWRACRSCGRGSPGTSAAP